LGAIAKYVTINYTRDGEPIYCHGPHEFGNIAGGQQKLSNFTLNVYSYLPKENKKKSCQGVRRETSLDLLPTLLFVRDFRVDAILCSNFGNEKFHAGRIKSSRWFPTSDLHNRPSSDFPSRVLLFNEALPWSLTKPQIMT